MRSPPRVLAVLVALGLLAAALTVAARSPAKVARQTVEESQAAFRRNGGRIIVRLPGRPPRTG